MNNLINISNEVEKIANNLKLLFREDKLIQQQIKHINTYQEKLQNLKNQAKYKPGILEIIINVIFSSKKGDRTEKTSQQLQQKIDNLITNCHELEIVAKYFLANPNLLTEIKAKHKWHSLDRKETQQGNLFEYVNNLSQIIKTDLSNTDSKIRREKIMQIIEAKDKLNWIKLDINETIKDVNPQKVIIINISVIKALVSLLGEYITGIGFNGNAEPVLISYNGKIAPIKTTIEEIYKLILKIDNLLLLADKKIILAGSELPNSKSVKNQKKHKINPKNKHRKKQLLTTNNIVVISLIVVIVMIGVIYWLIKL